MSPPIDIDGSEIQEATIDGQDVSEITIDGQQAADFIDIPDSGMFQDYDATELSLSDQDTINTFTDQSGAGNDAPGSATYVENGINGNPSARYDDAANDGHVITSFGKDFGTSFTSFIVIDPSTTTGTGADYIGRSGASRVNQRVAGGDMVFRGDDGGRTDLSVNYGTSPAIIAAIIDGSSIEVRKNGSSHSSGSNTTNTYQNMDFGLGQAANGGNHFDGDIGRYIGYDRTLSGAEINNVEDALASQFGISI